MLIGGCPGPSVGVNSVVLCDVWCLIRFHLVFASSLGCLRVL